MVTDVRLLRIYLKTTYHPFYCSVHQLNLIWLISDESGIAEVPAASIIKDATIQGYLEKKRPGRPKT